ncbi:MAG: hypothetical protein FWH32_01800, partial [Clostridiales bacterium]|nr:hypothetical protein [Clostridiales bacterium]
VELVAALSVAGADMDDIDWSLDIADVVGLNGTAADIASGGSVIAKALDMDTPITVQAKAEYENDGILYAATATIEILPDGVDGDTTIKLLEKAVRVNKAKVVGARVPVLITKQTMSALSAGSFAEARTGFFAVDAARLEYQDKGAWTPVPFYEARISPTNDRFVEISAEMNARNRKGVRVMLHRAGMLPDAGWFEAEGRLDLTAVTTYPKFTVRTTGTLNQRFPYNPISLSVTSNDGACTAVSIVARKTNDNGKVYLHNENEVRLGYSFKAGTVRNRLEVSVAGYKPLPQNRWPNLNVRVVNNLPRLRLENTAVTFYDAYRFGPWSYCHFDADENKPIQMRVLSRDKNWAFGDGYSVHGVRSWEYNAKGKRLKNPTEVYVSHEGDGILAISPNPYSAMGARNTSIILDIRDDSGNNYEIYLPLRVNMRDKLSQVSLSVRPPRAVAVSTKHPIGVPDNVDLDIEGDPDIAKIAKITDIAIAPNMRNLVLTDWEITSVRDGRRDMGAAFLNEAIWATPSENTLTLSVKNKEKLAALTGVGASKKYTLTIGSPKVPSKSFKFDLTVSDAAPTFSLKAGRPKIDIARPGSFMEMAMTLRNAGSEIESVTLWDVQNDSNLDNASKDFMVPADSIDGARFRIVPRHDKVVPKVNQRVWPVITLKNGDVLKSWEVPSGRQISITPTQTRPRVNLTNNAVTLHRDTPLTGQSVGIAFRDPHIYELGDAVRISEASLRPFAAGRGFELVQSGKNVWSVRFEGGMPPALAGTGNLKSSYNLTLEVWAEGTYGLDGAGKPIALEDENGKKRSTPTTARVRVNIR